MTNVQQDLDPTPLVRQLVEKSKAGKLKWEATADRRAFVVSVGGDTTFKVTLTQSTDVDVFGQPESVDIPLLLMLDDKGKTLWEIRPNNLKTEGKGPSLQELFSIARRIGNRLDERMDSTLGALEKL